MPFGPAIAMFVFALLCLRQQLVEAEDKRKAKADKQKKKEAEEKAQLVAEVLKEITK